MLVFAGLGALDQTIHGADEGAGFDRELDGVLHLGVPAVPALDVEGVVAAQELEEAKLAPVGAPAVANQPCDGEGGGKRV